MPTKVLSLRLEQRLYEDFLARLDEEQVKAQDRITEWVRGYVTDKDFKPGVVVQEYTPPMEKFLRVVEKESNLSRKEIFSPGGSAEGYYFPEMDFSWMFNGVELKSYIGSVAKKVISSSGWYLKLWLWTALWVWISYAPAGVRMGFLGLIHEWEKGNSPVDVVVTRLTEQNCSDQVGKLLEDFYKDPYEFW